VINSLILSKEYPSIVFRVGSTRYCFKLERNKLVKAVNCDWSSRALGVIAYRGTCVIEKELEPILVPSLNSNGVVCVLPFYVLTATRLYKYTYVVDGGRVLMRKSLGDEGVFEGCVNSGEPVLERAFKVLLEDYMRKTLNVLSMVFRGSTSFYNLEKLLSSRVGRLSKLGRALLFYDDGISIVLLRGLGGYVSTTLISSINLRREFSEIALEVFRNYRVVMHMRFGQVDDKIEALSIDVFTQRAHSSM